MSYDAHYRAYKELQARFGWAVDKATHWHRATAPTRLQQANADDAHIGKLALWLRDTQHVFYQPLHAPAVLAKAAGFTDEKSYFLWRALLSPCKLVPDLWVSGASSQDASTLLSPRSRRAGRSSVDTSGCFGKSSVPASFLQQTFTDRQAPRQHRRRRRHTTRHSVLTRTTSNKTRTVLA